MSNESEQEPTAEIGCIYVLTKPIKWVWVSPSRTPDIYPAGTCFLVIDDASRVDYTSGVEYALEGANYISAAQYPHHDEFLLRTILIDEAVVVAKLALNGIKKM